jgi:hypothetical protein
VDGPSFTAGEINSSSKIFMANLMELLHQNPAKSDMIPIYNGRMSRLPGFRTRLKARELERSPYWQKASSEPVARASAFHH